MHLSWTLRLPLCTSCGAGPHPMPLYPSSPLYQTVSNLQRMSMQTGSNEVGWGTADNSEDCSPLVITKGFIIPPHSWIPSVLYWTKLENLSPPEYVCNGFCLFITCFSVYLSKAAAPGHLGRCDGMALPPGSPFLQRDVLAGRCLSDHYTSCLFFWDHDT